MLWPVVSQWSQAWQWHSFQWSPSAAPASSRSGSVSSCRLLQAIGSGVWRPACAGTSEPTGLEAPAKDAADKGAKLSWECHGNALRALVPRSRGEISEEGHVEILACAGGLSSSEMAFAPWALSGRLARLAGMWIDGRGPIQNFRALPVGEACVMEMLFARLCLAMTLQEITDSCGWGLCSRAWVARLAHVPQGCAKMVAVSRARFQHVFRLLSLTESDPMVATAGKRLSQARRFFVENLLQHIGCPRCSAPCQSFSPSGCYKAACRCLASCDGYSLPDRTWGTSKDFCCKGQPVDHEIATA